MQFNSEHYDPDKILFFHMDDVYDMHGVVQKWHQPKKRGAVMRPVEEWEGGMVLPVAIYPTADGSRLRCQYTCINDETMYPELKAQKALSISCLAESTDGLHWERIPVGEVRFKGSTANNIMASSPDCEFKVIMDPHDPDPARRYKGVALRWDSPVQVIEKGRKGRRFFTYTSPDGIHWGSPREIPDSLETGDTSGLGYDDRTSRYIFTTRKRGYWLSEEFPAFTRRPIKKGEPDGRWVSLSTSSDFKDWTPLDTILVRDPADELGVDFYCGLPFPYGDVYTGWLRRHHHTHGTMDTELVWSRDSLRWKRSWYRKAFLEPGELGDDDWCFGDVVNCNPVRHGDELLIYYEGRNHVHSPHQIRERRRGRGTLGMDAVMGLSTLRLDGFVSLEAGRMGGEFITEPRRVGEGLTLNLRTVHDGVIAIDLLDEECRPLSDKEVVFRGDDCHYELDLAALGHEMADPNAKVRLRFYLENGAVYSIRHRRKS